MISEAFFMPKRRVFNSSLAWLAAARATEKLRNSGELRISLISFVTVCYLALRSER